MPFMFDPMTMTFISTEADQNKDLKASVRQAAHDLRIETVRFIEQQAEYAQRQVTSIDQEPPRLPVFYIKGFNLLKRLCTVYDFKCPILELVPFAIQMCWLSEYGKSPEMPKLVRMENRCLKYEVQEELENVNELVDTFFNYTEEYFFNYISISGECPEIPRFVDLMRSYFKKRFPEKNAFFEVIGKKLNNHLTATFGDEYMPADYFENNGCH